MRDRKRNSNEIQIISLKKVIETNNHFDEIGNKTADTD